MTETGPLSGAERRRLRGQAHDLDPVVQVGQAGLSDGVLSEIDRALDAHELIKIRVLGEREQRRTIRGRIESELGAEVVGKIGFVLILYRARAEASPDR